MSRRQILVLALTILLAPTLALAATPQVATQAANARPKPKGAFVDVQDFAFGDGERLAVLVSLGFGPDQAGLMVREAAEIGGAGGQRRAAAAGTLRFLERHGILEHDPTRLALEAEGLLP